ncbi:DMT family transporter [Chitinimonas lacunae]|uniref:DMT family transporter n=1 Tax=Chitinimonas lacunae TaxID=1963018 RepID=A0ABV8MM23_9NEIS
MSASRYAFPALLLGAACIGFAGIFVRVSEVGPAATGFWRMALALPFLWLLSARTSPAVRPGQSRLGASLLLGAFFAADLAVWHHSLHITTVANATLLANCVPVFFVPLLGWLIWRDKIERAFVPSFLITLLGVALLTGENVTLSPERFRGDLLATVAAAFYCAYLLLMKSVRREVDVARLMAVSGVGAAVVLLAVALMSGEKLVPASLHGWATLAGLAIVTQVLGQTLIAYGLGHLPAHLSALCLMFQPIVSALAAWALFGEQISPLQFAGAAVIVAGVWMAKRH